MTAVAGSKVCEAFHFFFEQAGERKAPRQRNVIVASTGGPGMSWEFALNEALRERARRRGDIGWRGVAKTEVVPVPMGKLGTWVAHVLVRTTLGDQLELWVKRPPST